MNLLFAVRVLFDFLSLAWIIIYAATQCAAKGKVRKVEKERPGKIRGRRMRRGPNNGGKVSFSDFNCSEFKTLSSFHQFK